jgi:hypothetical protein
VLPKHEGPSELRHRTNPKNPVRAALLLQKKFCALCVVRGALHCRESAGRGKAKIIRCEQKGTQLTGHIAPVLLRFQAQRDCT